MTFHEQGHLGGYVIGGDEATYYPDLWRWLVEERRVDSMLDVGCGEGHALSFFRDLGCKVEGIDGVPQADPAISTWDFTLGPWPIRPDRSYDLIWSCEFVEHVEEGYAMNFLDTFTTAPLVLLTHALPGQSGYHHVNCRPAEYWRGAMAAIGYREDTDLTILTRALAGHNDSPWNHYAQRGMAFIA